MLPRDEYGPGMPMPSYILPPQGIDGDTGGERGIDAAAQPQHYLPETAFANVIAGTEDKRGIRAGLQSFIASMNIAGSGSPYRSR